MNYKKPSSFPNEKPKTHFLEGRQNIEVLLYQYPAENWSVDTCFEMLAATWGTEANKLDVSFEEKEKLVEESLAGNMLGNALESLNYTFAISGISRATTHQIVRTRIGAAYAQHGGRDNDWRHQDIRIPETINQNPELKEKFIQASLLSKEIYSQLVDSGIPWQDARYIMPIGTATYIWATYTYRALQNFMANRLCLSQTAWELCTVAWKMRKEVQRATPLFGKYLLYPCEKLGYCTYAERSVGVHLNEACTYKPIRQGVEYSSTFNKAQNGSLLPVPIYDEIK